MYVISSNDIELALSRMSQFGNFLLEIYKLNSKSYTSLKGIIYSVTQLVLENFVILNIVSLALTTKESSGKFKELQWSWAMKFLNLKDLCLLN